MKPTVGDVIAIMNDIAPLSWADDWDNVGLQAGERDAAIGRVLLALEITEAVLEEAVEKRAGLIITHHPMYLKPPAAITDDTAIGRLMLRMIREGVAHYAAHTNLDKSDLGPDAALCRLLDLKDTKPLVPEIGNGYYQLVTFCPAEQSGKVKDALFAAGCGHIGAYSNCSFSGEGVGTFLPGEETHPHTGIPGILSKVAETRIEVVVPKGRAGRAVNALYAAHPYEEPVIDLYSIRVPERGAGIGRIGTLPSPLPLDGLAAKVKGVLGASSVTVCGDKDTVVKRLALCAGAGGDLAMTAKSSGADAFLTGEIKHHGLLDIGREGLPVIAAGHYHTETPAMILLAERLREEIACRGWDAHVEISERTAPPGRHI